MTQKARTEMAARVEMPTAARLPRAPLFASLGQDALKVADPLSTGQSSLNLTQMAS